MPTDRTADTPTACASHEVAAVLIVRAKVCEGTTAQHLAEFLAAIIEGTNDDLHEDIRDELCSADFRAMARPVGASLAQSAARLVTEDCAAAIHQTEAAECMQDAAESPHTEA